MTDPKEVAKRLRENAIQLDGHEELCRAALAAADLLDKLDGAVPAGVAVKPLEWTAYGRAQTFLGAYELAFTVTLGTSLHFGGKTLGRFENDSEAKAAAQADYEQRIRRRLAIPASRRAGRVADRRYEAYSEVDQFTSSPVIRDIWISAGAPVRSLYASPVAAEPVNAELLAALKELAATCEEEFIGDVCLDEPDDEPVSKGTEGDDSRITFGMIRRARAAIAKAEAGPPSPAKCFECGADLVPICMECNPAKAPDRIDARIVSEAVEKFHRQFSGGEWRVGTDAAIASVVRDALAKVDRHAERPGERLPQDRLLHGRDDFIVEKGLWLEFVDWLQEHSPLTSADREGK